MKKILLIPTTLILTIILSACTGTNAKFPHVAGLLDEPLPADTAPAHVLEAMERAERYHQYEIMSDTANDISVEAIGEADTTSTEGYGIVVVKGATSTVFPHIPNSRQPLARYCRETGDLWLTCSAMAGTGVAVERLYQIRFNNSDSAYIANAIDPYALQQQLCQRLGYSIDGEKMTLYDRSRELTTATNTVTDMGDFDDEHPLWIGEQMQYDLSGNRPCLLVTPGVKYTTGLVLTYDDMPTLSTPIGIDNGGKPCIGEIAEVVRPFEGSYLDEDNSEPNLFITYRRNDGRYDVAIGIFRLTSLDDGIATMGDNGLSFTATDAAGNPIEGLITLQGDTATVTFTRSTWPLLENGTTFRYTRQ